MQKRRRGRPAGSKKGQHPAISARIPAEALRLLEAAAFRNKRTLSREIAAQLDYAVSRYRKGQKFDELPRRIQGLLDSVALAVRTIEKKTGRPWNEDQYTSQHLARMISGIIADFTLPGEVTIPSRIIEWIKGSQNVAGEAYATCLGEEEARAAVWAIKIAEKPSQGPPATEYETFFLKLKRDLTPRRGR